MEIHSSMSIKYGKDSIIGVEYGCRFRRLLPWAVSGESPQGVAVAIIEPDASTIEHSHDETECFYVIRGSGFLVSNNERVWIREGDFVKVSRNAKHYLTNADKNENFEVLCIWSGINDERGAVI